MPLLVLQNIETGKKETRSYTQIINGQSNPWTQTGIDPIIAKDEINAIGAKSDPPFYVEEILEKRCRFGNKLFKIKCDLLNKTLNRAYYLLAVKKQNPFSIIPKSKTDKGRQEMINNINKVGQKLNPKISCVEVFAMKKGKKQYIKIKNEETGQTKKASYHNTLGRKNPWNRNFDRHEELVVHPMVKKYLTKHGFKFDYEVKIGKKEFVDFTCLFAKKTILIEVKSDEKYHSPKQLSNQIKRYEKAGKRLYGESYGGIILMSPKGRYETSLPELRAKIKSLNKA